MLGSRQRVGGAPAVGGVISRRIARATISVPWNPSHGAGQLAGSAERDITDDRLSCVG